MKDFLGVAHDSRQWREVSHGASAQNHLVLYHGSDHCLRKPAYKHPNAREDNDYGKGFYTTQDFDKACAWAVTMGHPEANVVNRYLLNTDGLTFFNFANTGILAWCAEIVAHRGENLESLSEGPQLFVNKYKVNTEMSDVIIGYRADDSYMSIVEAFFDNLITIEEMERMFRIGELGEQVFIKSEKAFGNLIFDGYTDQINNVEQYLLEDSNNRSKAETWLKNRRTQIFSGFSPQGITASMCIQNNYVFNTEYGFYEMKPFDTPGHDDM